MGHYQAPRGSGRGGRGHSRHHQSKSKGNQRSCSKQAATPTKKEPLMKFGVNTATTNYAHYATIHEKIVDAYAHGQLLLARSTE